MSNKILLEIHHPLVEMFENGVSIAERRSIEIATEMLFRTEYDAFRLAILPNVADKIAFAKTLFQSVLATDIAAPDRVKLGIKRYETSQIEQDEYDVSLCPLLPFLDNVSQLF